MRRILAIALLIVPALVAMPQDGQAAKPPGEVFARLGPIALAGDAADALHVGAGLFNFGEDDSPAGLNLEYRLGRKLFFLGPSAGLVANSDRGIFGYAGIYAELAIGSLYLTPQISVGGYAQNDSKDLGGTFQFRESLDVAWGFEDGPRVGVRLAHISNAGIYDINPGAEEIYLVFALPLGPVF